MKNKVRERKKPKPCDICGTIEQGLYFECEETKEWLCKKCNKEKYPGAQRIH